jgi:magnesium chelatase subunit I
LDQRSGVSQRLPISVLEAVVSNAERRAIQNNEAVASPRIADIYAAAPSMTGKIELEYEGEQLGAERIANELIRRACSEVFVDRYMQVDMRQPLDFFSQGKIILLNEMDSDANAFAQLGKVKGLVNAARSGKIEDENTGTLIVACELILEGLHAQKKVARSFEKGEASYKQAPSERKSRKDRPFDDWDDVRLN